MSESPKNNEHDALIARYREASAQENAQPSARVREAVLARARVAVPPPLPAKKEAANDRVWGWKIAASVAAIGFTGMVARHYIEAPPEERATTQASATEEQRVGEVKQKAEPQVAELAAAASALKPPAAAAAAPATSVLAQSAADQRASETRSAMRAAPAVKIESRKKENEPPDEPRRAQKVAPELATQTTPYVPEPPVVVADNKGAAVRDQDANSEALRRRRPEMSTGDVPLAAPAPAPLPAPLPTPAPALRSAAAPMPSSAPTLEARVAPSAVAASPVFAPPAPAPAPTIVAAAPATAQRAAAAPAPAPARAAESRIASGFALPAEPALIAAIRSGDSEALRAQLATGANENALTRDGTSALALAAQRGRSDDVAALLRAGALVNARDAQGRTALKLAMENGFVAIAEMLRAAGGVE